MKTVTLGNGSKKEIVVRGKKCLWCGETFYGKRSDAIFCSSACQRKDYNQGSVKKEQNRRYKDKKRHGRERARLIKKYGLVCLNCGKKGDEFTIIAHHETFDNQDHREQKLLCRSCHAKAHGLGTKWPTREIECGTCGVKFVTHRWHTLYCSAKCERASKAEKNRQRAKAWYRANRAKP